MLKADLHIHSRFSRDSESTAREIIEAALDRSLDVISVTDHDSFDGSREAMDTADDMGVDLVVMPGQETSTESGHLLVLGVEEQCPGGPLASVIDWTHDRGGICVAPHPFQRYRHGIGKSVLYSREPVDGIEVCNSRYLVSVGNWRAERMATSYGYPMLGGSDAHIPEMVGRVRTLIDAKPTVDSVLDAIRDGRTTVRKGKTPTFLFVKQLIGTVKGRLTG